jgi:hypothetical protein
MVMTQRPQDRHFFDKVLVMPKIPFYKALTAKNVPKNGRLRFVISMK